jgi:hypothetical protein
MKKILILMFLYLLNISCVQEYPITLCDETCDSEKIIEIIVNKEAKVIEFYDKGFILTTNQDDFEHEFFVHATDDFILVPCNWTSSYPHNTRVIVSGKKTNCCGLLSFPNEFRTFGCKFEITSIKELTDNKDETIIKPRTLIARLFELTKGRF